MRKIITVLLIVFMASSVFAFTDIGLLKAPKTIGGFIMPRTTLSSYTSGLIYSQGDLEVMYTSFNSFYLITTSITRLGVRKKINLAQLGPLKILGKAGPGFMYRPSAGGGFTADVGLTFYSSITGDLTLSLPIDVSILSGGAWINVLPGFSFKTNFMQESEFFGGYHIILQGSSFGESSSGSMNSYYVLGIRKGL